MVYQQTILNHPISIRWARSIYPVGRIASCFFFGRQNGEKREAEAQARKPNQCRHSGRRNMAGKAGGLKGVALIGGGATARSLALYTSSRIPPPVTALSNSAGPSEVLAHLLSLLVFASRVCARVHRGEGQGHGPGSGHAWIPHPRLRRHHQRLQLHRCVAFVAYHGFMVAWCVTGAVELGILLDLPVNHNCVETRNVLSGSSSPQDV